MRDNLLNEQTIRNYETEFERIKRNPFSLPKKEELKKLKHEIMFVIHKNPGKILYFNNLYHTSVKLINDIDEEIKKA